MIKYIALFISLMIGLIGTLSRTKKKNNKITNMGYVFVILLFISFAVSIISEYQDNVADRIRNEEHKRKSDSIISLNTNTLKSVRRLLNPIGEFSFNYEIVFSLNNKIAKNYKKRITKLQDSIERSPYKPNMNESFELTNGKKNEKTGNWLSGNIYSKSKYFPDSITEPFVHNQIQPNLRFGIFKDSIDFIEFLHDDLPYYFLNNKSGKTINKFDIYAVLENPFKYKNSSYWDEDLPELIVDTRRNFSVSYRTKNNTFVKSKYWKSNDKITSLEDLYGAYLVIYNRTKVPKTGFNYKEKQLQFNFWNLWLKLAPGRIIYIAPELTDEYIFKKSGYFIRYYRFPKKDDSFDKIIWHSHLE